MINTVAEIGVNWAVLSDAVKMIHASADIGCNYVKFQVFNEETIKGSPLFNRLEPLILREESIKILHDEAVRAKIGFILTPMYLEAVDVVAKYADIIKIRFKDHENEELINKASETGKPLLVSVPKPPINMFNPQIKYLYCLALYPPAPEDFNLDLSSTCQGFSSHFPHTLFDIAYAINRLHEEAYIEKHVISDTNWATPPSSFAPIDFSVSITFATLKEFISQLTLIERIKRTRI